MDPIQHLSIIEPDRRIFYVNDNNHICFQGSANLYKDPTKHLFHLRLECKDKLEADNYHWLVSYKLN